LSELVQNFGRFWPSQILLGAPIPKFVSMLSPWAGLMLRPLVKFREVTPTIPNVIGVNTLNFKPNSPLKFWGTPDPVCGVR